MLAIHMLVDIVLARNIMSDLGEHRKGCEDPRNTPNSNKVKQEPNSEKHLDPDRRVNSWSLSHLQEAYDLLFEAYQKKGTQSDCCSKITSGIERETEETVQTVPSTEEDNVKNLIATHEVYIHTLQAKHEARLQKLESETRAIVNDAMYVNQMPHYIDSQRQLDIQTAQKDQDNVLVPILQDHIRKLEETIKKMLTSETRQGSREPSNLDMHRRTSIDTPPSDGEDLNEPLSIRTSSLASFNPSVPQTPQHNSQQKRERFNTYEHTRSKPSPPENSDLYEDPPNIAANPSHSATLPEPQPSQDAASPHYAPSSKLPPSPSSSLTLTSNTSHPQRTSLKAVPRSSSCERTCSAWEIKYASLIVQFELLEDVRETLDVELRLAKARLARLLRCLFDSARG